MPRQDVPYGGAICRLKERIAEIWDELGKKLHSINGVEGDGAGDVKIVSGDPAVVITNDQLQNEIEISLDTSQLPAAAVSSVNGQTGAVALTADDIPSDNGDVQTDLDNLASADTTLQGNINAEALARQNADSTLQTNINAALATIPREVTSQIANNATIQQLVVADGQNVKLTGNQSISGINTVPTETTGTYSQQIANSQKVENELDNYAPMVRTSGNQTVAGNKTFTNPIASTPGDWHSCNVTLSSIGEITLFAKLENPAIGRYLELEFTQSSNTGVFYGHIGIINNTSPGLGWFVRKGFGSNMPLTQDSIVLAKDGSNNIYIGARRKTTYGAINARVVKTYSYGAIQSLPCPYISWLTTPIQIGTGTGYTLTEALE